MKRGLALGWLLLVLLLAGCGKENTLTVGVYSGSYWNTPNGDCYQILDNAIARFQEDHPGVKVEYVSGITTDGYSEWLAEKILKGTEPDLYFVLPEDFNLLVSSGALARLDGRMDSDPEFDSSAYYQPCLQSGSVLRSPTWSSGSLACTAIPGSMPCTPMEPPCSQRTVNPAIWPTGTSTPPSSL